MTKIFEALEHARKDAEEMRRVPEPRIEPTPAPVEPVPRPEKVLPLTSVSVEVNLEHEMTALYQSLNSLLPDTPHKVIQFMSSRPGEGTSTIIRELAKVIATVMGRSVLLLDIDRRRSSLKSFFDCNLPPELDEVAKGALPVDRAICQVEGSRLFISPLFQHSVLTPQKLGSDTSDDLWEQLRRRFEYVLIDSPAVTVSSDGLAIARKSDGIVFVIEAEKTRGPVALAAKEKIVKHGGNILGMVFNKRRFYIPHFVYKRM
jgi:protein-tyrosine kinase